MDVAGQLLVAATADRKIQTFSLSNPGTPYEPTRQSPLKFQTRSLACLPDQTGYAIGSVEARVGIQCVILICDHVYEEKILKARAPAQIHKP